MSMVSTTLAKYVDKSSGYDVARVATFDIKINGESDISSIKVDDLFANAYKEIQVGGMTYYAVRSSDDSKVVAPGTSGSMAVNVSGHSEVMLDIVFELTIEYSGSWAIVEDGVKTEYFPVVFLLNGKVVSGGGFADGSLEALEYMVDNAGKRLDPNAVIANELGEMKLGWIWAMNGTDEVGEGIVANTLTGQTDERDTKLGNMFLENEPGWVSLSMKVTITQVT